MFALDGTCDYTIVEDVSPGPEVEDRVSLCARQQCALRKLTAGVVMRGTTLNYGKMLSWRDRIVELTVIASVRPSGHQVVDAVAFSNLTQNAHLLS
jgi:hypothetical protein